MGSHFFEPSERGWSCNFSLCIGNPMYKLLFFGHRNLSRNTTQTAVINIFKIRILLNLTFRMFVHIHFQKYNRYGFWEAIYVTTIGV